MRDGVYRLAQIVAWPAAAWCTFETALHFAWGEPGAASQSLLLAACAAGMIATAGMRRRQLARAGAHGNPSSA